jgi:5-hydroxyisourate hydrolase
MIDRISTHILNTTLGVPALGVPGVIERFEGHGGWLKVGAGTTDVDGRIGQINGMPVLPGDFRLTFDIADYFQTAAGAVFYPFIVLNFRLDGTRAHYHLPVLASTYSYATYLGS